MPSSAVSTSRWYSSARCLRGGRATEAPDHGEKRRQEEHLLEERSERVDHEGAVEEGTPGVDDQRQPVEPGQPHRGDEARLTLTATPPGQAEEEDEDGEGRDSELERQEHHGRTPIRSSRSTTDGSTRETARAGTRPNRMRMAERNTRAHPLGPLGVREGGPFPVRPGRQRPPEDALGHAEHVDGGEEGAQDRREEPPPGSRLPGPEEGQDLGDESCEAGKPEGRQAAEGEARGDPGHPPPESAHAADLARVGLLVDEADQREEEPRHDPVGEHLVDRAVEPGLRQGGGAQHDEPHVGDRRVGDDVLQIRLGHGREGAVHDVDHRHRADQGRPVLRRLGQERHRHPDDAVGAELHQHARVEHRDRRGGGGVAVGRPRVERPDARQDAEAHVEGEEHPALGHRRERHLGEHKQGERVRATGKVEHEETDQDER